MNTNEVAASEDYWRVITRNEDYLRQWGHNPRPDWKDKWHQDLEDAYTQLHSALSSVSEPRVFHNLPRGLNPFAAENAHQALMFVLNPPERWFGDVGVLCSPEYLALKREVEKEWSSLAPLHLEAGAAASKAVSDPFEGLNDTAWEILNVIDRVQPRRWKEIALLANYSEDKVRQYSTALQEKQFIKKIARGFIRLVPLPNECEPQ